MCKKNIRTLMFVLVTLLVLTACESKDNNSKKDIEIKDTKESVSTSDNYKMLTNQQKEYLSSIGFEEDSINKMSYESVNYYLLGTGFELYNQSSGVEIFGISYKLTDKEKKQIEDYQNDDGKTFHKDLKKITYKEAENIRGREKKIRLSHFLKYQGEIRYIREKEKFALFLPVEQMQELYVLVLFEIDDNNTLKMKAPSLHYTDDLEKGITMSFYYLSAIREMVIDRDVNHKDSKDVYAAIRYSSVTDHSLVIELSNATEKELSLPKEYKIYKYSEDGEDKDKVYEGTLKNIDEKILGTSMYSLEIEFDEQLAEGTYMIEYGMNKENCVYETLDFTIDKGVVKK